MTCGKCVGLALASIGWAAFIVGLALEHMGERSGALIVTLAQWVIVTGLGVAIVGATETGFGALDRFFSEIAARTRKSGAQPGASDAPAIEQAPALAAPQPPRQTKPQPRLAARPAEPRAPTPAREDFERVYAEERARPERAAGDWRAPAAAPYAAHRPPHFPEPFAREAYRDDAYRDDAHHDDAHHDDAHHDDAWAAERRRAGSRAPRPTYDESATYAAARAPRPEARSEPRAPVPPRLDQRFEPRPDPRQRPPAPVASPASREALFPEFAAPDYAPPPRARQEAPAAYHPAPAPAANAPEPARERPAPPCVERGEIAARPYRKFADGSVEIDTLLGARRFATMEDACAFVGARAPTPFEPDAEVA